MQLPKLTSKNHAVGCITIQSIPFKTYYSNLYDCSKKQRHLVTYRDAGGIGQLRSCGGWHVSDRLSRCWSCVQVNSWSDWTTSWRKTSSRQSSRHLTVACRDGRRAARHQGQHSALSHHWNAHNICELYYVSATSILESFPHTYLHNKPQEVRFRSGTDLISLLIIFFF